MYSHNKVPMYSNYVSVWTSLSLVPISNLLHSGSNIPKEITSARIDIYNAVKCFSFTLTMMIQIVHNALTAVAFASKDIDVGMTGLVSNKQGKMNSKYN